MNFHVFTVLWCLSWSGGEGSSLVFSVGSDPRKAFVIPPGLNTVHTGHETPLSGHWWHSQPLKLSSSNPTFFPEVFSNYRYKEECQIIIIYWRRVCPRLLSAFIWTWSAGMKTWQLITAITKPAGIFARSYTGNQTETKHLSHLFSCA